MPRPIPSLAACALLVLAGACDRAAPTEETAGLTAEEFVAVVVELRRAERELVEADVADADSAERRFEERKMEILDRHGTTEEEIREFVTRPSRDLRRLEALWETIAARLRYVPMPDTAGTAADSAPAGAGSTPAADSVARRPRRPDPLRLPPAVDTGG